MDHEAARRSAGAGTKLLLVIRAAAAAAAAAGGGRGASAASGTRDLHINPEQVARVTRVLAAPLVSVRVGKLLASHGRTPGRLTGPCTLSADDRTAGAHGRLTLRISLFDSMLRLKWEARRSTYHPREELLAIVPVPREQTDDDVFLESTEAPPMAAHARRCPEIQFLEQDPSGRSFCVLAGSGAGATRRFFWIQEPSLELGKSELLRLQQLMRAPPSFSQLTSLSPATLAAMEEAAPALMDLMEPSRAAIGHTLRMLPAALKCERRQMEQHRGGNRVSPAELLRMEREQLAACSGGSREVSPPREADTADGVCTAVEEARGVEAAAESAAGLEGSESEPRLRQPTEASEGSEARLRVIDPWVLEDVWEDDDLREIVLPLPPPTPPVPPRAVGDGVLGMGKGVRVGVTALSAVVHARAGSVPLAASLLPPVTESTCDAGADCAAPADRAPEQLHRGRSTAEPNECKPMQVVTAANLFSMFK